MVSETKKFKVGDRVRFVCDSNAGGKRYGAKGEYATVASEVHNSEDGRHYLRVKLDDNRIGFPPDTYLADIEPIPATPATLTISAGKFYKTRDGRKVGPMVSGVWIPVFYDENHSITSQPWNANGQFIEGEVSKLDLIAEWVDEPVAHIKPKFKVGDKVRHKDLGYDGFIEEIRSNNIAITYWPKVGWGGSDPFDCIELITAPHRHRRPHRERPAEACDATGYPRQPS